MPERSSQLQMLKDRIRQGPGGDTQVAAGKFTIRDRIDMLLDPDTFHEIEALRRHRSHEFGLERQRPHTDGVVTGWGLVHGRRVFLYGHDFRILGGTLGEGHAQKIHKLMDLALSTGAPLIALNDGAGARIQEGVLALAGYGGIFLRHVRASGVIPQISLILGPCAGGAAYSPALTDFVLGVRGVSRMFLTGPDVVAAVTGQQVSSEELGGADVHAKTGVMSLTYDDEQSCLEDTRFLLSLLPSNNAETAPAFSCDDPPTRRLDRLLQLVPTRPEQPYDMRGVIAEIVDNGEFFETQPDWGASVLCVLARLDGHPVGIVANQPLSMGGALDAVSSEKAARFVTMCNSFNLPLVTLVDVPGFMPGVDQEHNGVIRRGAKLLFAYCNATVPRVQVILRKAYGGAYIVMDSRSIGCDLSYAWPTNEIAVMGAEGAADIVRRASSLAERDSFIAEYKERLMHPHHAAECGLVDDLIDPRDTRAVLIEALAVLRTKQPLDRFAHASGNPPQ